MQIEPIIGEIAQGTNTSDDLLQHTSSPIWNVQETVQTGENDIQIHKTMQDDQDA
jgi:hypothetical protein